MHDRVDWRKQVLFTLNLKEKGRGTNRERGGGRGGAVRAVRKESDDCVNNDDEMEDIEGRKTGKK